MQTREYRSISNIMGNTSYKSVKKIAAATVEYINSKNEMFIRYHDTDIVHYHSKGITLNSGGYRTRTTKLRMNTFFNKHNMSVQIIQDKGLWYIDNHLFYDGITINNNGIVKVLDKSIDKKAIMYKKQIDKFMLEMDKMYKKDGCYPFPNGGDCWLCIGNMPNTDHVLTHLKETYVHGTLIKNALISSGYTHNWQYVFNMESIVKRTVKKYLKKCTGIIV